MKTTRFLAPALLLSVASLDAASVLDNLSGPVSSAISVKGTGGFIPTAQEYGFEFTVGGGDHYLDSITLSIGNHFGSLPLTVELYSSPTGPDSAVFLAPLLGPSQPANQLATYAPSAALPLLDGSKYFVRLWVNGSSSSYAIFETSTAAAGVFVMGNNFQRSAGSSWGAGDHLSEPLLGIQATAIPEPVVTMLGSLGLLLLAIRRR